jgi:hypothetical protein
MATKKSSKKLKQGKKASSVKTLVKTISWAHDE